MRIAIVDDDTGFIKKVETVIEDYCRKAGEAATVRLFSDGGILLEEPGQERGYDAYILDVEMPRLDGLELARRIREREEDADIIFLSSFAKYALPAYKVRAYDYIMKERYRAEIPAVLDRIQAEKQRRDFVEFLDNQGRERIERAALLDHLHKDHRGCDDEDGVDIGEGSLHQMPQRDPLSADQRADHRGKHHRNTDRQLEQEAAARKHHNHGEKDH